MTDEPFVHSHALCESEDVGAGTRVWAFAHVMQGAVVGRACNIGDHAVVETGARVGDGVTIKNGVTIPSNAVIADSVFLGPNAVLEPGEAAIDVGLGATIGANVTIGAGCRVGTQAFVAAGAVVAADVANHAIVVGDPAHQVGWVCECAVTLDDGLVCPDCRRIYVEDAAGLRPQSETP